MINVDDLLNGSYAGPYIAPPLPSGNSPMVANGAGNASSVSSLGGMVGKTYASSNTAIVLVWIILLVLLVLSHTFTFSLQE